MNSTLELINNRISLRKYLNKPILPEHEAELINAAMRAPTAGNMMLYSIIVIKDPEKRSILSRTCDNQPFIATAPLVMIFVADYQKLYDYYKLSDVQGYCKRKHVPFKGPEASGLMLGISDALIAAQNAVIAGESLGIGSCYIGDIMENYETHRELLKLPDYVFPIGMLTFGYYPEESHITPRSRFQEKYVVFQEEYRQLSHEELFDLYHGWSDSFHESNPFEAENAGQMNYARKTGADFSVEMERSVREAMNRWHCPIE